MAKRKSTREEEEALIRKEEWQLECQKLLTRARWLNDWEEDFLEQKVANDDDWTEPRAKVTSRIKHETNLVGSIDGVSVWSLITSLAKVPADMTDDDEEWLRRLLDEKCERVAWRDARRLLKLASVDDLGD